MLKRCFRGVHDAMVLELCHVSKLVMHLGMYIHTGSNVHS